MHAWRCSTKIHPQLAEHLRPVFDASLDELHIWLDEERSACNQNLAQLFGLTVETWSHMPGFLSQCVS